MFKKLIVTALVVGGVVTFVGADVVGRTLSRARESVRASLTSSVPLRTQVAEARAQVDRYAENVIRGEIAAEASPTPRAHRARGEGPPRRRRAASARSSPRSTRRSSSAAPRRTPSPAAPPRPPPTTNAPPCAARASSRPPS